MQRFFSPIRLLGFSLLALALAECDPSQSLLRPLEAQSQATSSAPQQPLSQQLTMRQQQVRQLIQQVENAFALGQTAYHRGDLIEAKTQFDRAIDLMLSSPVEIKSDTQLQDEFDKIVDGVNALEMDALKQGNGFVPKEEETPADVASDVTFEADPNIVARARTELATTKSDLPLVVNDYVGVFIKFFSQTQKGHNTLLHAFQRSGRYRAMIQRVMAEEGVPQDLIYLAVAESGFQPRAINRKSRAGGMWQFMPSDSYGLARNLYVDERFDPEKSTRAYARYMKFIYNQLGDWYLAMAAYDWGAGNVQRAVQKTGYADFWELYRRNNLPAETKNYVPEILAAIIIANHPTQYGFDDLSLDPPVLTDTVSINYSVDLRLVSDIVQAPLDELMALNPSLLRMATPETPFDLHLPAGAAALFNDRIGQIPETRRSSWRYHRVVAEDTLASIAREYHVSESELADANQLHAADSLQGLEAVVVPVAPSAAPSAHMVLYTARRGDTLVTIADRFGVSLSQLRLWNHMSGTKVDPGRRLHVAEPAVVASSRRHHAASTAAAPALSKSASKSPSASATARSSSPATKKPKAKKHATASGSGHSGAATAKPTGLERRTARDNSSRQLEKHA